MTAALPKFTRAILVGLAAGLTAWSGASGPLVAAVPDERRLPAAGSTESASTLQVSVSGGQEARPYENCLYYATARGGSPPYSYQWFLGHHWSVGNLALSYSEAVEYANNGSSYTLTLVVTDNAGVQLYHWQNVTVSNWGNSCNY